METENNLKNFKYIVYETTNLVNGKIYIGVHQTVDPNKWDHYLGNGILDTDPCTYNKCKTNFQRAVNKYGPKNFRRKTLAIFNTAKEAYLLEEDLVNEEFLKRDDVYNMILGGEAGVLLSQRIKVYQYDLDGNYVGEFPSMAVAALQFNCDYTAISYAVRKKTKCSGFYWNTDKLNKIDLNDYNSCDNHRIMVYQYSKDGKFLNSFESYSDAYKKTNINPSRIKKSCVEFELVNETYFLLTKSDNYADAKTLYVKSRPVYKFEASTGKFLEEYEHQKDAEKQNPDSNISRSIRLKTADKNGFLWGVEKLENYNVPIIKNAKRKVGKFDLKGNLITEYSSATAAAKENGTSVWKVLSGTNQTHKQHTYRYI